jgi:ribonuclease HI
VSDPGETMEHAYGTCTGLDELWVWAAETFLLPAGGAFAAKSWTSAIQDQDKGRRPLVTGVGPHILAGLLGVVKVRNDVHLEPKERKELAKNLNAWWSLIRASILVVLDTQRQNARRGIDKYKVSTVARPPLHITKECVLQRLRARVAEEAMRVPEQHMLMDGILFAGVLGHVLDERIVLSAALGGASVSRRTPTQLRVSVAPRRGPAADWRRPTPPPDGAQHAYLFFDGASRNNPGPAAGGCVLKASNGIDTLVQDSEFLGKKTNNEAEICGLILGLHRALAAGITALSIRGDSQLIIAHITGRARCTTRSLSPLLDRALRLMDPRAFPHGIDVQWVRRNCNVEADTAANAGLRARNQERRILFFDN